MKYIVHVDLDIVVEASDEDEAYDIASASRGWDGFRQDVTDSVILDYGIINQFAEEQNDA